MRTINFRSYSIDHESWEEMAKARRENRALVLQYRDRQGKHRVTIDAGESDEIDVFREGELTLVLSTNSRYGYAGIQAFKGSEETGSIFLQNSQDLEDILGRSQLDLSPITIAKRLSEYL
jgi:hypothetical protein